MNLQWIIGLLISVVRVVRRKSRKLYSIEPHQPTGTRLETIQKYKLQDPVLLHLFNLYDNSFLSLKVLDHCAKIVAGRESDRV